MSNPISFSFQIVGEAYGARCGGPGRCDVDDFTTSVVRECDRLLLISTRRRTRQERIVLTRSDFRVVTGQNGRLDVETGPVGLYSLSRWACGSAHLHMNLMICSATARGASSGI